MKKSCVKLSLAGLCLFLAGIGSAFADCREIGFGTVVQDTGWFNTQASHSHYPMRSVPKRAQSRGWTLTPGIYNQTRERTLKKLLKCPGKYASSTVKVHQVNFRARGCTVTTVSGGGVRVRTGDICRNKPWTVFGWVNR